VQVKIGSLFLKKVPGEVRLLAKAVKVWLERPSW
jgi:hypothetical protein